MNAALGQKLIPSTVEKIRQVRSVRSDIRIGIDGGINESTVSFVNKEKPDSQLENLFLEIQNWLNPKINRGSKYKFGWINSNTQNNIIQSLGLEKNAGPILVLINRGSRKRYHVYNGEMNEEGIKKLFDSLAGGDVRFKPFSGNKIPEFEN